MPHHPPTPPSPQERDPRLSFQGLQSSRPTSQAGLQLSSGCHTLPEPQDSRAQPAVPSAPPSPPSGVHQSPWKAWGQPHCPGCQPLPTPPRNLGPGSDVSCTAGGSGTHSRKPRRSRLQGCRAADRPPGNFESMAESCPCLSPPPCRTPSKGHSLEGIRVLPETAPVESLGSLFPAAPPIFYIRKVPSEPGGEGCAPGTRLRCQTKGANSSKALIKM